MNNWYNRASGVTIQPQINQNGANLINAFQNANDIFRTIQNPVQYARDELKRRFPGIPDSILNDPMQILNYMQQSMGITNEQIMQAASQIPPGMR